MMRKLLVLVTTILMVMAVMYTARATTDILIPIETVVKGPVLSEHVLLVTEIPDDQIGKTCKLTVHARNQDSAHPNSNLTFISETRVDVLDVENAAFGLVFGGDPIVLNQYVTAYVTLGADKVFSGGFDAAIDCPEEPAPSTTTSTTHVPEEQCAPGDALPCEQPTTTTVQTATTTVMPRITELPHTGFDLFGVGVVMLVMSVLAAVAALLAHVLKKFGGS